MGIFKEKTEQLDKKIYAFYLAVKRRDTPLYAKICCGMFIWYALSPLDLIPDFIPVLGAVDDIIILPFLIWLSVKLIPEEILAECKIQAEEISDNRENRMKFAIPIMIIWALLAVWLCQTVIKYIPMPL